MVYSSESPSSDEEANSFLLGLLFHAKNRQSRGRWYGCHMGSQTTELIDSTDALPVPGESGEDSGAFEVLVVDDEEGLRHLLRLMLAPMGCRVREAQNGQEALTLLRGAPSVSMVLCDIRMPQMDGLTLLDKIVGELDKAPPVVMMSAYGTSDTAMESLRRGAYDYISKPFQVDEVRACVERVAEKNRLENENRRLKQHAQELSQLEGFVGQSEPARLVMEMVRDVAGYPSTVLLTGESGTGKELLAKALHVRSAMSDGPFVPVNCAAIPEALLESELFGHVKGAFTGAVRDHLGVFERANGGTLLLDEIGDMPLALQSRLLRVLEDGVVRRVGGMNDKSVQVRVIGATGRKLEDLVASGAFRQDLFYRLNVVHIRVPPLRDRKDDIPLLTHVFVQRSCKRLGKELMGVGAETMQCLLRSEWPGNVRQLINAIERAVLVCRASEIAPDDLPTELRDGGVETTAPFVAVQNGDLSIKRQTAALERALIVQALHRTEGNRSAAARLLDISYKALLYKIRDYGIEP